MVKTGRGQQGAGQIAAVFSGQSQSLLVERFGLGVLVLEPIDNGHRPRPLLHFGIVPGRCVFDQLKNSQAYRRGQIVSVFGKVVEVRQII